jgi:hypothetical protein
MLLASQVLAGGTYIIVVPATHTYRTGSSGGVSTFMSEQTLAPGQAMSFSGTSLCNTIQLGNIEMPGGQVMFQMQALTGTTLGAPVSGTTFGVFWRGTNVDTKAHWELAPRNTVFSGINAYSGATLYTYDLTDLLTGVTPYRLIRFEFDSGVSASTVGTGNLIPTGSLFVR